MSDIYAEENICIYKRMSQYQKYANLSLNLSKKTKHRFFTLREYSLKGKVNNILYTTSSVVIGFVINRILSNDN